MTTFLLFGSTLFSVGLVAGGYSLAGFSLLALLLGALGVIWIVGIIRGWKWIPLVGLLSVYGFAAAGFFLGLSGVLMFVGALLGLSAWDLSDFSARLKLAAEEDDVPSLERRHMLRLMLVLLPGAALVAVSLIVHIRISFEWMVVLILVAVWGFGRMVAQLLH